MNSMRQIPYHVEILIRNDFYLSNGASVGSGPQQIVLKSIRHNGPSILNQTTMIDQLIGFDVIALYPFDTSEAAKLALAGVEVS